MKVNRFVLLMVLSVLSLTIPNLSYGQAIRKKYNELTAQEKINYVNALNSLYTSGIITDYRIDHLVPPFGFAQHNNDDFLPWHRIFLYYFEQELRSVNSKVSLVYWDWTNSGDWSSSSVLFSNGSTPDGLLGQPLDPAWDLSITRTIGGGMAQPTNAYLNSLVSGAASYTSFRNDLEDNPHDNTHGWVGGTMSNPNTSPQDPVFYLHHAMVDKVWQDWTETKWNGSTIPSISTSLGTITGKSNINSNDIIDSRALKVWYAVNDNVVIDKYTVSNTTLGVSTGTEKYHYTGTVNFSTSDTRSFVVPNTKTCEAISAKEILLNPGFLADAGSVFEATINTTLFNSPRLGETSFDPDQLDSQYDNTISDQLQEVTLRVSPNPSSGIFDLLFFADEDVSYEYVVYNAIGNPVQQVKGQKGRGAKLDLTGHQPGIYIIKVQLGSGELLTERLIVN